MRGRAQQQLKMDPALGYTHKVLDPRVTNATKSETKAMGGHCEVDGKKPDVEWSRLSSSGVPIH